MEETSRNVALEAPKYTVNELAALVEEMIAKGYDQMKARVLTAVEAATGQNGIGDKPLGRQIGYALDDAKRIMLDVLARRVPEITPAMLAQATEARCSAEHQARLDADVSALDWEVQELRGRLERAEERLKARQADLFRVRVAVSVRESNPETLKRVAEIIGNKYKADLSRP